MKSASGETGAQQRRTSEKSKQILRGAAQVFLAQGYDRASMNQVAKMAGVSKQTLYAYFEDKQALFKALVERMAEQRFKEAFEEEILEGSPDVVLPQLIQQSLARLTQDTEYHDFIRIMIGESKNFPDLIQVFLQNITLPSIKTISNYLRSRPELEIPDTEATAHVLLGALVFYILTQEVMAGKDILPMTTVRLSASLINLLGIQVDLS